MTPPIRGAVFDKDGTLYDFDATWSSWAARVIDRFAAGARARAETLAQAEEKTRGTRAGAHAGPIGQRRFPALSVGPEAPEGPAGRRCALEYRSGALGPKAHRDGVRATRHEPVHPQGSRRFRRPPKG